EVCGVGHGDAAVLTRQPEPARPRHGRLAAAVRCDLRAARPEPPVPVAEPGPPLAGDPQPQLRPGPVPGHEQHAAPAPNRRLGAAARAAPAAPAVRRVLPFPGPGRWEPRMTQAVPPSSTWFPQVRSPPRRLSNRGSAMSRCRSDAW